MSAWRRENSSYTASPGDAEILVSADAVRPFIMSVGDESRCLFESKGDVLMSQGHDKQPKIIAKNAAFPAAALIPGKGVILAWESSQDNFAGIFAELIDLP